MADGQTPDDAVDAERRVDRRSLLRYGGAGALTAGLAGCQSPDNPIQGMNFRGRQEGVEGDFDEFEEGEDILEGQTIKIGVLGPMNLVIGESMWAAAQMAADQINEVGVLGAEVEVVLGNTETSPGVAESEHRRLCIEEDVDATCGIYLGSALMQTLPSIADQERIHLTTGSADPRAGELVSQTSSPLGGDPEEEYEQYKYHFRVGPIHLLDLADALLEFLEGYREDLGWETAAILTENLGELDLYHEGVIERLGDNLDIPIEERPGGVTDWSPLFNEIESEGCDVALIGLALSGTTAVNQWANQQRDFSMGGIHVPAQAYEFWEATDGNVEYVWTMNAMTPQTENTELTQEFVQGYIDRFDSVPMYVGPLTFDGIRLYCEALIECVQEEELTSIPDSDTLIPYLEDYTFTNGTIIDEFRFTPPDAQYGHEPQWPSMEETGVPVYQQWQHDPDVREDYGTMHSFAPEQNKTADYAHPEWIGD